MPFDWVDLHRSLGLKVVCLAIGLYQLQIEGCSNSFPNLKDFTVYVNVIKKVLYINYLGKVLRQLC